LAAVVENPADLVADRHARNGGNGKPVPHAEKSQQTAVDLGIWLGSLHTFLNGVHLFEFRGAGHTPDASLEMDVTIAVLDRCLVLCSQVTPEFTGVNARDIHDLAKALKDLVIVGRCIKRAKPVSAAEWMSWRALIEQRLSSTDGTRSVIRYSDADSEAYLPEPLLSFTRTDNPLSDGHAELALVLPRFGRVLRRPSRWLSTWAYGWVLFIPF
jgi:hypothetical protein